MCYNDSCAVCFLLDASAFSLLLRLLMNIFIPGLARSPIGTRGANAVWKEKRMMPLRFSSFVLVLALMAAQGKAQTPAAPQEKPRPPAATQSFKGNPITRGEVARLIYEAFKSTLFQADKPGGEATFKDVPTNDPDFKVISVLGRRHIFSGDAEGNFNDEAAPSRYEMAQAFDALITELKLTNIKGRLAFTLDMPRDIPANVPAYGAVERLIKLEVALPFNDGYFRGRRPTTDAEVTDGIARVQELVKANFREGSVKQKK